MKPGDTIQIRRMELAYPPGTVSEKGVPTTDPSPMTFWIFATVQEVLEDGAFVEVFHPGNVEHETRKKVLWKDLRTAEQVQALHDAHPLAKLDQLSYQNTQHLPLINYRAALERMKNPELIRA